MSLRIDDTAPDLTAETTQGPDGCKQPLPYVRLVRQPSDS